MHLLKNCIFLTINEARYSNVFREKREFCLFSHNAFFKDRRFGRIDSCSMFGEHNCVRSFYVHWRRCYRKLCCFYKILKSQSPKYLYSIIPIHNMSYRTRQCNKIPAINVKHDFFKNTFFPSTIME